MDENEVVCLARVSPLAHQHCRPGPLRTEDGHLPITLALEAAGFEPGDVVEIRLYRRDGSLYGPLPQPRPGP